MSVCWIYDYSMDIYLSWTQFMGKWILEDTVSKHLGVCGFSNITIVISTFPELIQIMINDGLNFTLSTSKK